MGERKRRPRGDRKSTEMSTHLEETFAAAIRTELYPRSQIDIFVEVTLQLNAILKSHAKEVHQQVLQADGGNYTTCVNAAMMALVDAGVPLKDTVVSCTASLVKNVPLVDVNHVEQSGGSPELVVSILPHSGEVRRSRDEILFIDVWQNYINFFSFDYQIVYMSLTQRFHIDHLSKVLDTAIKGCKDIGAILKEIMKGHLTKLDTSLQASWKKK